jgi:hypothetical protein
MRIQSLSDIFAVSHPAFLWMFRTSRYWPGISTLIPAMRNHLIRTGVRRRFGSGAELEINDQEMVVEHYPMVFKELFCLAAADLAEDLKQPIENLGILYDEIVPTGQDLKSKIRGKSEMTLDVERDGMSPASVGSGQLLFLVKCVNRQDAERLQGAGFRFANIQKVLPLLSSILRVPAKGFKARLDMMRDYANEHRMLDPGVHLALFAVRASLAPDGHGFDVLARIDAKNVLPTMQLPFDNLEAWHVDYLKRVDNSNVTSLIKFFFKEAKPSNPSLEERDFAKTFLVTLEALKEEINDPFFNDATLIANPIKAPCQAPDPDSPPGTASLITFRMIVPLHCRAPGRKLIFAPLNYFNVQQHCYKNSPEHNFFARMTHREFESTIGIRAQTQDVRPSSHFGSTPQSHSLPLNLPMPSLRYPSSHEVVVEEEGDYFGNPVQPPSPKTPYREHSSMRSWDRPTRSEMRANGDNSSEKRLLDALDSSSHSPQAGVIVVSQESSADKEKVPSKIEGLTSPRSPRKVGIPTSPRSPHNVSKSRTKPEGLKIEMKALGQGPKGTFDSTISNDEQEPKSFVDELFLVTVARRHVLGTAIKTQSTGVSAKSDKSIKRWTKAIRQLTEDF